MQLNESMAGGSRHMQVGRDGVSAHSLDVCRNDGIPQYMQNIQKLTADVSDTVTQRPALWSAFVLSTLQAHKHVFCSVCCHR